MTESRSSACQGTSRAHSSPTHGLGLDGSLQPAERHRSAGARRDRGDRAAHGVSADVADVLALTGETDYSSATRLVGRAVRDLMEAGELPSELMPTRHVAVAKAAIRRPVELDTATLCDALDPAACGRDIG